MNISIQKITLDKLLRKQLKIGSKLIKLSGQIKMKMTYEQVWKVSSTIEQSAYDLAEVINEINSYLLPDHYISDKYA